MVAVSSRSIGPRQEWDHRAERVPDDGGIPESMSPMTASERDGRAYEFSVRGARDAAAAGLIHEWVDAFLTNDGPGANLPMAVGLAKQRRWWIGPLRVPLSSLTRICGPEPEMEFRTSPEAWEAHVSEIARAASSAEQLPPLILEYRETGLSLRDGNHRHEALCRRGETHAWALIWCNSAEAFDEATSTHPSPLLLRRLGRP